MIKFLPLVLALSLLPVTNVAALPRHTALPQQVFSDSANWPKRPYDVISYDLLLDWRGLFFFQSQKYAWGKNTITLQLLADTSSIELDAEQIKIDSLIINGHHINQLPQPDGNGKLTIPLTGTTHQAGDLLTIVIAYSRTTTANDGLYFYPKGTFVGLGPAHDSVFVEEDLAYTMSEPLDANKWMPCNKYPYDKAMSQISIIVPTGFSAQSNGTLQGVDTVVGEAHMYRWKSDRPIASYLMVADASKFIEWSDEYHRVSDPNDSVRTVYYAWPPDYYQTAVTDGSKYNAQNAMKKTPLMLAAFSKRFGEYPFLQYGQVPVQPFNFGGMEHQTMTTIARVWFRGFDEDGIAHELMHQWFGDKTTCETFSDIWLNEGFATYGEAVWEEDQRGPDAYLNTIRRVALDFFYYGAGTNKIPVYAPPIENVFNYQTTYAKGACMLHMMRRLIDDDTAFFATLRDYSNAFAYTTANTEQFRDFIQARVGTRLPISLTDFVDQWIYQPDYPIYSFKWFQEPDNTLLLRATQSQDSTDHYSMVLRFNAFSKGVPHALSFVNTQRVQSFKVALDYAVDSIIFDQTSAVLALVNDSVAVSRDRSLSPLKGMALPVDPQLTVAQSDVVRGVEVSYENGLTKLSFSPVVSSHGELRIVDALGRVVNSSEIANGISSFVLPTTWLPSGTYFAILHDGTTRLTAKLRIVK